jgi:hypothetical protein
MKMNVEMVMFLHAFVMSALDRKVAHYCRFTPRKEPSGTKWVGSWVIPKAGLKFALHCPQNVLNIVCFIFKDFKAC